MLEPAAEGKSSAIATLQKSPTIPAITIMSMMIIQSICEKRCSNGNMHLKSSQLQYRGSYKLALRLCFAYLMKLRDVQQIQNRMIIFCGVFSSQLDFAL